jgi:hypothetical protein
MKKPNKDLPQILLILSSQFMKDHTRAGEPTHFKEQIEIGLGKYEQMAYFPEPGKTVNVNTAKLHTLRAKYKEWEAKIARVNRGEAVLRVVTWAGAPYRTPWVDVCILTKDDGVGVQKVQFDARNIGVYPVIVTREDGSTVQIDPPYIAKNDGLSLVDMVAWFKEYDLTEPLAIIHFTKFRY